jgi:transcription-repair coupling factor (superfamily II helicase)
MSTFDLSQLKGKKTLGLDSAALPYALGQLCDNTASTTLIITGSSKEAAYLCRTLSAFSPHKPHVFSGWETLPYDTFSPHQDITSGRLAMLSKLVNQDAQTIIVSIQTLMHPVVPPAYLGSHALSIQVGDTLDLTRKQHTLEASGYLRVDKVFSPGDFAIRGSILDIYPMGSTAPYRIDLFDDTIDAIRTFNVGTQRSDEKLEAISILPASEVPLDNEHISCFKAYFETHFKQYDQDSHLYESVLKRQHLPGLEYFLPCFFEARATLLDYLNDDALLIYTPSVHEAAMAFWETLGTRYNTLAQQTLQPLLPPKDLFLSPDAALAGTATTVRLKNEKAPLLPDLRVGQDKKAPYAALSALIEKNPITVLCAQSAGRAHLLEEHLARMGRKANLIERVAQAKTPGLYLCIVPLDKSFVHEDLACISELDLFAGAVTTRTHTAKTHDDFDDDARVFDISELNIDTPVVHINHGIGRYQGLTTLDIDGQPNEFLTLEYAKTAKLYVPISHIHLISRYHGLGGPHAPLNSLGSDKWQKSLERASKRVSDLAAELLDLYAKRQQATGTAFKPPDDSYLDFTAGFPFDLTGDQGRAIDAVFKDLTEPRPMDRLLCGDVGFGKTEVALRAAFLAVQNQTQVAVLVPTTLLCQQHYDNFIERFAHMPVRVAQLSRFVAGRALTKTLADINAGKIDIVIGTHKLLSKLLSFKSLGLVVVDEEHRFGVKQKEQLKALKTDTNILTMTATPIPRTLNMALSHMRDLSLITTPPAKRLSIQTFVHEDNKDIMRDAILRERMRGGQVYVLHNEVASLSRIENEIKAMIPDITLRTAHGQMKEREMESIMADFYHNRFCVLVCTTIIETGIDVPNANTMIIERADKFGLAQLHQLRGRVGRSHHQAYAYLFTPPKSLISADAKKRLRAIASTCELGAGFNLASHDLEIRGAGSLLGDEQSGHIEGIGFSLYLELLEKATKALKSGKHIDEKALLHHDAIEIGLGLSTLLPEKYIFDIQVRLDFYRRIAAAASMQHLDDLQVELIDRFGLLPDEAKHLFVLHQLRLQAKGMGITALKASATSIALTFNSQPTINVGHMIQLVQRAPKRYKLEGGTILRVTDNLEAPQVRIDAITALLSAIR